MSIHPAAFISETAIIGKNVTVGPGAVIEAGCEVGDGCEIRAHAVITGGAQLGERNQVGYGAIIGAEPQDLAFRPEIKSRVVVGNDNVIREYATLHRGSKEGTQTAIGHHNYLMAGCHVAHNVQIGNHVILVNNVLLAGYVEVQDRAFLGGAAVVHQFVRIGAYSIIRGQTRIGKDLPPYFMAVDTNEVAGLNRVALRRNGFSPEVRRQLQSAFNLLYFSGRNISQAVEEINQSMEGAEIRNLVEFIRGSRRGICLARSDGLAENETDEAA
jgi:UDP-N-acetylglucosamine acyltransferase